LLKQLEVQDLDSVELETEANIIPKTIACASYYIGGNSSETKSTTATTTTTTTAVDSTPNAGNMQITSALHPEFE
jgi:hypothetical protein